MIVPGAITTLRNQILDNVLARLREQLPEAWKCKRKFPGRDAANEAALQAFVYDEGEQKVRDDSMHTTKDLLLRVMVRVWIEQSEAPRLTANDPDYGGNIDPLLHDCVGLVEKALQARPPIALAEQLLVESWGPFVPEGETEENVARAIILGRIRYRHNAADPFTYNPQVVG